MMSMEIKDESIKNLLDEIIKEEDYEEYFSLAKTILNHSEYQKRLLFLSSRKRICCRTLN